MDQAQGIPEAELQKVHPSSEPLTKLSESLLELLSPLLESDHLRASLGSLLLQGLHLGLERLHLFHSGLILAFIRRNLAMQ